MPSPFPGMDPYLENPDEWPDIHTLILANLRQDISIKLPPHYVASVESRLVIEDDEARQRFLGRADLSVREREKPPLDTSSAGVAANVCAVTIPEIPFRKERYIEIRDGRRGRHVVTVIELLSPSNKRPGNARDDYLYKREQISASDANLVEIDLLRTGFRMPMEPAPTQVDYCVLVSRSSTRPVAELYAATIRQPLPPFALPLAGDEVGPVVDLNLLLAETYDRGALSRIINYTSDPIPPLSAEDAAWADALLREKGLR